MKIKYYETRTVVIYRNKEIPMTTWWQRRLHRKIIKQFGGKCQGCGKTKSLQFAHTKTTELSGAGRGTIARLKDIMAHPKCYALFCRDCHLDYDSK